jgi:hypothetical protein
MNPLGFDGGYGSITLPEFAQTVNLWPATAGERESLHVQ